MIVTVNNLAKTYKLLPSEVLARGTTFDLFVLDTATRYVQQQQDKTVAPVPEQHTTQQLMAMLQQARGAK